MELRELQRPLKERYREDPSASRITLSASGAGTDAPEASPERSRVWGTLLVTSKEPARVPPNRATAALEPEVNSGLSQLLAQPVDGLFRPALDDPAPDRLVE